jgi:Eco29kI restriction endonuclease
MPVEYVPPFFDPLSTEQLANTICEMFERQPLVPLASEVPKFLGSGLYAIYYRGTNVDLYKPLAGYQIPVYAGQGASSNSATGNKKKEADPVSRRLDDHRTSIIDGHLPIAEFRFRALLMPDVHANLGENALRVGYQPVWNRILTGFGGHEQGQKTRTGAKSRWDTVHPGRKRSFGSEPHDPAELSHQVKDHIVAQIEDYWDLGWPHPVVGDHAGPV